MADIDTTPPFKSIQHYAGDTLTLKVTVPAGFADGYVWTAQLRKDRATGTPVDAVFIITQPATPGDPGYVTLRAEDCQRLARSGVVKTKRDTRGIRTVVSYTGEFDVQVAPPAAADPVTTLVQGSLSLELDVTREDSA